MAECAQLARTSAYFDGALDAAGEAEAAAHLATCAQCQTLLGDAVGLDAALADEAARAARASKVGATRAQPRRSPRRWPWIAGALAAAAAVAAVLVWPRGVRAPEPEVAALALPAQRALEARFTGPAFAAHRPRAAMRADVQPREAIPLAALARLEQGGDRHDLIAALAASGDLARATDLAAKLPDDARGAADRAALALAAGQPARALGFAQHALALDPALAAARWNLALAARDLHLDHVARAAFAAVDARHEPGWAAEAAEQVRARDAELAAAVGYAAFDQAANAMIAGGAPLSDDDVARYPARAREAFYDAARLAPDRARLTALAPLARALDTASGTQTATAALARIDPAVTAPHAAAYRALIARTATPAEATTLIAALGTAGRGADDMRLGAIILSGQAAARLPELRAIAGRWNDPWFGYFLQNEELRAQHRAGDPRALPPLADAVAACTGDAYASRCGVLAYTLAERQRTLGHDAEAEAAARRAVTLFRAAVSPVWLGRARALLADIHRLQGRGALARAELEETVLAANGRDCDGARYARITEAELAIADGDWGAAREALPPATPPAGCTRGTDVLGVAAAVDLARATGDRRDAAAAAAWLATASELLDGGVAAIGALRAGGGDRAAVTRWLAEHPRSASPDLASVRAWGVATLIDDAGARGAWDDAIAAAAPPPAPCVVVASADDDRVTVAVRTPHGTVGEHRRVPVRAQATAQIVSDALAAQLAQCADIAVVARPPLHGRSDLLPPGLPWWFAGDAPPNAAVPGAPPRALEVADARPPDPSLPAIAIAGSAQAFDARITGTQATPRRVLAALATATYAELHVHGVTPRPDTAYLALSPDTDGEYALRTDAVAAATFATHPVIVLAACRAAVVAPYLRERWSLPDAFVRAGATAVIAADAAIPDAEARAVFDDLHRRIAAGEPVAAAVAAVRANAPAAWVTHLMVFR